MEILYESRELKPAERYEMTAGAKIRKLSEIDGRLEIDALLIFNREGVDGEIRKILSILTPDHEIFATNSATFIQDVENIISCFDGKIPDAVNVMKRTSKKGRTFMGATLDL